ncbi:hypothetical protein ACFL0J_04845 [Candidatus Neomarinimicrobiota bacterium]
MKLIAILKDKVSRKWTGIYLRILSVILGLSALAHIGSTFGFVSNPWGGEITIPMRILDVVLLVFNIVVAIGLWLKKPWAIVALVTEIVLLQIIPFTLFRHHFILSPEHGIMLNKLMASDLIMLSILAILLFRRK